VFRVVRKVNGLLAEGAIDRPGATSLLEAFTAVDAVIQVMGFDRHDTDPQIRGLIAARRQARRDKDWKLADRLRDELLALGVTVRDDKVGD
jgi:cysteinyl-tRNA synthetase